MKTLSTLLLGTAAFIFCGAAAAQGITAPTAGQIIFEDDLVLTGNDVAAQSNSARWAVRFDTCAANTNTVAGNVDGFSDAFSWSGGQFEAMLDISALAPGEYCFVLNTGLNRFTQLFYIVDQYAKVSGRVDDPFVTGKGRKEPIFTFYGLLGLAGSEGTVGSVTVNYKMLGDVCEFTGGTLTFPQDGKAYYGSAIRTCTSGATGPAALAIYDRMWTPEVVYCRNVTGRGCLGVADGEGELTAPYRLSESIADGTGPSGGQYQSFSADIDAGNGIVVK